MQLGSFSSSMVMARTAGKKGREASTGRRAGNLKMPFRRCGQSLPSIQLPQGRKEEGTPLRMVHRGRMLREPRTSVRRIPACLPLSISISTARGRLVPGTCPSLIFVRGGLGSGSVLWIARWRDFTPKSRRKSRRRISCSPAQGTFTTSRPCGCGGTRRLSRSRWYPSTIILIGTSARQSGAAAPGSTVRWTSPAWSAPRCGAAATSNAGAGIASPATAARSAPAVSPSMLGPTNGLPPTGPSRLRSHARDLAGTIHALRGVAGR